MGYCSDVVICVPKEEFRKLTKYPESEVYKTVSRYSDIQTFYDDYHKGKDWIILYYYYRKWYREYEDVKTITKWYQSLPKYQFFRLGEDFGDIEIDNNSDEENLFYVDQNLCENF